MVTITPARPSAPPKADADELPNHDHRTRRRQPGWVLWLILPMLTWLLAHSVLVRPAQSELAQSQQVLLAAEREELAAELALERENARRQHDERELRELQQTAERMRIAQANAEAQLAALPGARADHVFPGQGRPASGKSLV